jgi:Thioredoxin-like
MSNKKNHLVQLIDASYDSLTVTWPSVPGAIRYVLEYKVNTTSSTSTSTSTTKDDQDTENEDSFQVLSTTLTQTQARKKNIPWTKSGFWFRVGAVTTLDDTTTTATSRPTTSWMTHSQPFHLLGVQFQMGAPVVTHAIGCYQTLLVSWKKRSMKGCDFVYELQMREFVGGTPWKTIAEDLVATFAKKKNCTSPYGYQFRVRPINDEDNHFRTRPFSPPSDPVVAKGLSVAMEQLFRTLVHGTLVQRCSSSTSSSPMMSPTPTRSPKPSSTTNRRASDGMGMPSPPLTPMTSPKVTSSSSSSNRRASEGTTTTTTTSTTPITPKTPRKKPTPKSPMMTNKTTTSPRRASDGMGMAAPSTPLSPKTPSSKRRVSEGIPQSPKMMSPKMASSSLLTIQTIPLAHALGGKEFVLLYAASRYSKHCKIVTSKLVTWYNEFLTTKVVDPEALGASRPIEIVLLSMDQGQLGFEAHMKDVPWLGIDFTTDAVTREQLLHEMVNVWGEDDVPKLMVLHGDTGTVVVENLLDDDNNNDDNDYTTKDGDWKITILEKWRDLLLMKNSNNTTEDKKNNGKK